ncbi:hypothetical protein SAMN02910340_02053 [Methanosarcina thermophila]|jgi:hypothetical protein|uniref:Uncharacterized protein n=4 Tax=Methanosarcina thermophila TaxID=2210 RepID=A0A1I7ADA2_METTE|nr:hypothetical protein [Methanosarcina thermophila]ALK06197.1 MAG: hypothetical protein AAY43_11510 [Methanosarcina sp. 795]NLU57315.1 hypothetical protein [Methanosarcina thermophila]SFT72929.1 hypothetical protein SAMN02910340_02053 [Methanosarcina thermophila]HOA69188.1 hypothetical protein [Methanosarcina thermophila]HOQ65972.1 hypothetical protein [Methanosarcina thermophila]
MAAFWSRSRTLGTKPKGFSWRIDNRGNLFIKRKFRNSHFPRIDKISCRHLDRLCEFMQDREWKALANNAAKLYTGTEKDGIGKFLYKLHPEVSYAQLSSHLGAIFYQAGVWEWNKEKRGMEFLLLSENWKEKTIEYYRDSLNFGSETAFFDNFMEFKEEDKTNKRQKQQSQKGQIETFRGIDKVREIEQMKLSAFFRD